MAKLLHPLIFCHLPTILPTTMITTKMMILHGLILSGILSTLANLVTSKEEEVAYFKTQLPEPGFASMRKNLPDAPTYLRTQNYYPSYQKQCHHNAIGPGGHYHYQKPDITSEDINNAVHYATGALRTAYPEYIDLAGADYRGADHKEVEGQLLELVGEYFSKYKCFTKLQLLNALPQISVPSLYALLHQPLYGNGSTCLGAYQQACSRYAHHSRYRSIDGSCNNLGRAHWGRANGCQSRLLPPDYADGLSAIRVAASGRPLPPPRDLSNYGVSSVSGLYRDNAVYSVLTLAWAQLFAHDLTLTATGKQPTRANYQTNCCKRRQSGKCSTIWFEANQGKSLKADAKDTDSELHLLPYTEDKSSKSIEPGHLNPHLHSRCTNFQRAHACPSCTLGPRAAMNRQTSFLDGSLVYGTSEAEASALRLHRDGLLLAEQDRTKAPILPASASVKPCSALAGASQRCFTAGDRRVNQHPILVAMHTILLRRHNHHATKLKHVNSGRYWNDERLFQEARRLLIAEIQHITFAEYVPFLLGPRLTAQYGLGPLESGYSTYNPTVNPSIRAEFSIAGRFGHSQIKDSYRATSAGYGNSSSWALAENFFEPGFAWGALTDDILRGAALEPSGAIDYRFSYTARNLVTRQKGQRFGIDLVSTNTLRGRDLGLPGYVYYLKGCFNFDARKWADLGRYIPLEVVARLEEMYDDIQDIDLYIGGNAERPLSYDGYGSRLGPTFSCIIGGQLWATKYGDRYFYEHGRQAGSFTPAQLDNIRSTSSLASFLCHSSAIGAIQPNPFYLPSGENPLLPCAHYPDPDYRLWREEANYHSKDVQNS